VKQRDATPEKEQKLDGMTYSMEEEYQDINSEELVMGLRIYVG
jgi:hypothetical protein